MKWYHKMSLIMNSRKEKIDSELARLFVLFGISTCIQNLLTQAIFIWYMIHYKHQCLFTEPGLPDCGQRECYSGNGQRGHSKRNWDKFIANRLFKPLPEMEYKSHCQKENNHSWQDSMMFASYTRLVSKNYCSAKLLYASMTSREHQRYKIGLTVPLYLGVPWILKNWKTHIAPEAMDSNLINQWCKTFKAGRPGQLLDFLQFPIFYFWILVYASQSSKQTWKRKPSLKSLMSLGITNNEISIDITMDDSLEVK